MKNRSGFVLPVALMVMFVISMGVYAGTIRSMTEIKAARLSASLNRSFHLAEAGVDFGLQYLNDPIQYWVGCNRTIGGIEGSAVVISCPDSNSRVLVGTGSVDGFTRTVEVVTQKNLPPNFFNYAIWGASSVEFDGNSYLVEGDVFTSQVIVDNGQNVDGTVYAGEDSANPLPVLDREYVKAVAAAQGHVYNSNNLSQHRLPTSFWYIPPTDPNDPTTGIPNVVYIEGDLPLNGLISIGGFYMVVGDILTDGDENDNTTVRGNGTVEGAIYTTGQFRINGGGRGLNINGGVWASRAYLNGNSKVTYNGVYMRAIENLKVHPGLRMVSWREI